MTDTKKKNGDGEQEEMSSAERRRIKNSLRNPPRFVEDLLVDTYDRVKKQKAPVADLIRLLQYRRELGDAAKVKEIKVRWVEPSETDDVSRG